MPGWNQAHHYGGGGYQPIGVPMAGIDRSTARAIAVVALLFVAAWALRGYLPGVEPVAEQFRARIEGGPGSLDPAPATFADGVATMEVLDAIRQSAREGRSVELAR